MGEQLPAGVLGRLALALGVGAQGDRALLGGIRECVLLDELHGPVHCIAVLRQLLGEGIFGDLKRVLRIASLNEQAHVCRIPSAAANEDHPLRLT